MSKSARIKRKLKISLIILAIALPFLGAVTFNFVRSIDPNFLLPDTHFIANLTDDFANEIQAQVEALGYIDFGRITDFEWSHLLIVTPYQNPWQILEDNNIRLSRLDTGIQFNDGHNLLIFINDNEVIAYIEVSLDTVDFRGTIRSGQLYPIEDAIFFIFR